MEQPVELGGFELRPAFQPIVDLRRNAVVGFEALLRGGPADGEQRGAADLLAAAERDDSTVALDLAAREAALRAASAAGLARPFSLFINADARTLDRMPVHLPTNEYTLLVEVPEAALIDRPDTMLRALSGLRSAGWGIALDDVGGDSRSLALMSMLYPDVIKLDLRRLAGRDPADVARIVTAVGEEAERRRATVLAEGIDSEQQLQLARSYGASLGQGFELGLPAPLPSPLPQPGRELRLSTAGVGDPFGASPWERVTNWRRPTHGSRGLVTSAADVILEQAAALGDSTAVLATLSDPDLGPEISARYSKLQQHVGFVGLLGAEAAAIPGVRVGALAPDDDLRSSETIIVLAPDFAACLVAQHTGEDWMFALSYDRDTVVECALPLMVRIGDRPGEDVSAAVTPPPR